MLRLTILLADLRPCDGHRDMMSRKEEETGQGNLGEQVLVT